MRWYDLAVDRNEISRHEIEVYRVLLERRDQWLTNAQIGATATSVAARTIRATTLKLARAGVIEQALVFPGHRYRLGPDDSDAARGYRRRVERAAEALGVQLTSGAEGVR